MTLSVLRLLGLEPDNLLAFLALLGTMRCLDESRPHWNARVRWSGAPWRPELLLSGEVDEDTVVAALSDAAQPLAEDYDFGGRDDLKFPRAEARDLLSDAAASERDGRERLWSAIVSDGATKGETAVVVAPPLCTMLGQGHQHFLKRLAMVTRGILPSSLAKAKRPPSLTDPEYFREALFAPWERDDPTDAFRWDPAEDRRYALRDVDPSGDPATTEHGANRLAALALPLLTSFPTGRRGSAAIATVGFSRGGDRKTRITWPIWSSAWDLDTIVAALDHPSLHEDPPRLDRLAPLDVVAAYRSYRIEVGYYANFSLGEAFRPSGRRQEGNANPS